MKLAVWRADPLDVIRTKCVASVALDHCIHPDCPVYGMRQLLVELQLTGNDASIVHANNAQLVKLEHGILDELRFAIFARFRVMLQNHVHRIVAEDALGYDFASGWHFRQWQRKKIENFV